jgi:hypothetical protein
MTVTRRTFCLGAAAFLLAACATPPKLAPTDTDAGYVVFGLVLDGDPAPRRSGGFNNLQINWREVPTANGAAVGATPPIRGYRRNSTALPPLTDVQYMYARVAPGTYFLQSATVAWGFDSSETTNYAPADGVAYVREMLQARRLPSVTIKGGELLYIGDFYFKVGGTVNAVLSRYGMNEEAARAYVAQYPGLQSPLTVRRLQISGVGAAPAPR